MLYNRLCDVCFEKGTTLTAVLRDLNISTGNISRWKKGSLPNIDTVAKIADHLGVSIDYLVGHSCDDNAVPTTSAISDPEWAEIISHIPAENQQMCKDFLKTHMVVHNKYERKIG